MSAAQTPWNRAKQARKSQLQEERFGRSPGAKQQLNSGRVWFSKRDNKKFDFLVENRTTDKDSYSVKVKELKKLAQDAIFHHSLPAMNMEFLPYMEDWTLIRTGDFEAIYERLLELEAALKVKHA